MDKLYHLNTRAKSGLSFRSHGTGSSKRSRLAFYACVKAGELIF